jgi:hypothetical protein
MRVRVSGGQLPMPMADELIRAVEHNLSHMHGYAQWRIGTTAHPEHLRAKRGYPAFWRSWYAETENEAASVLEHFAQKGMQLDPDQGKAGAWVYLF